MQRFRVSPPDLGDRLVSQRRQDVVVQRAPVDALRVRVAVHRDMRLHVAFRQVGDRQHRLGRRRNQVFALLDAVDDGSRPVA